MDLSTALAQATENGWTDDSACTPSFITHQVSLVRDDLFAAVTVTTDGTIKWGVCPTEGQRGAQRGTARTIPAAITACHDAIAARIQTLF